MTQWIRTISLSSELNAAGVHDSPGLPMTIAGAGNTLRNLLEDQLQANKWIGNYSVSLFTTSQFSRGLSNQISLFLYRIDIDEARRQVDLPRPDPSSPRRTALGLELYYLLTVWGGGSAAGEHEMLGRCMDIFQRHPIVSGTLLDPTQPWEPNDSLRVTLAQLTTEDMLRLWDSLDPPYQLSVPYMVRTVRLSPQESPESLVTRRSMAIGKEAIR